MPAFDSDRIYFFDKRMLPGRQIVDILQLRGIPEKAIAVFTSCLQEVPTGFSAGSSSGDDDESGWQPYKRRDGGPGLKKMSKTGIPMYKKPGEKGPGHSSEDPGSHEETHSGDSATSPSGKTASDPQTSEAGEPSKVTFPEARVPEGLPSRPYSDVRSQRELQSQLRDMHSDLAAKYAAKGDEAALRIAGQGSKEIGPMADLRRLKSWAGKVIDSGLNEATDWVRAIAGDAKKSIGDQPPDGVDSDVARGNHAVKSFVANVVRLSCNPIVETLKIGANMISKKTRDFGYVDHDAKALQEKWGTKTANLVLASGSALANGVGMAGIIAGPAILGAVGIAASPVVAAAAMGGMAAMLHYCPGFRAFVSRAPARLALYALNKLGIKDTLKQKEEKKRKPFEEGAAKAGFSEIGFAGSSDTPSPEKIREIAKVFFQGLMEKFLTQHLLKDRKLVGELAKLGQIHHADPKMVKKAIGEINKAYPLKKKGKADFSMPDSVIFNGKIMDRADAYGMLRSARVPRILWSDCVVEV